LNLNAIVPIVCTPQLAQSARICRYEADDHQGVGIADPTGTTRRVRADSVAEALISALSDSLEVGGVAQPDRLLAPIGQEEVWGAGVTYERSREARVHEAEPTARDHYTAVYDAPRAELFFKATANRVVGPEAPVVVRGDVASSVPEPEIGLWLDRDLALLGVGLGNDLTARDLEAENPLYLPQAKIWQASCSLGPWVVACNDFEALRDLRVELAIRRDDEAIFSGSMKFASMRRHPSELIEQLGRFNEFPGGVVLLTGTGIVPPDDIDLRGGDEISIRSPELGELRNGVSVGEWPA
jgi:2-dehydro-3-deoxy-D-arabinonate dehydratase